VQQSESPLLHAETIITDLHQALADTGFQHRHTLPFPMPTYPSGWWSCTLAAKDRDVTRFREADVAHAGLETTYYSVGTHHGALQPPPFCRNACTG